MTARFSNFRPGYQEITLPKVTRRQFIASTFQPTPPLFQALQIHKKVCLHLLLYFMKKKSIVVTMTVLVGAFVSCHEPQEELNSMNSEKEFYKTIGEEIPFETGMEWIEYYQRHKASSGRTELEEDYLVSSTRMNELLASTADLVGVAFHYGSDASGVKHIILIPVDGTLSLWSSIPGRIFVDANSGEQIDQNTANTWATNYKNAHPSDVWFHFFGKYIFDDMTSLPYFTSVDIEQGINTLELTPELLLIVWNEDLNLLGRTSAQSSTVYDASNACPPCAVQ